MRMGEDADTGNRETLLSKMILDPIGAFLAISDVMARAGDEIAMIRCQRDDLLAACEKQEELRIHTTGCQDCMDLICQIAVELHKEATALRQAAIAKAKEGN